MQFEALLQKQLLLLGLLVRHAVVAAAVPRDADTALVVRDLMDRVAHAAHVVREASGSRRSASISLTPTHK